MGGPVAAPIFLSRFASVRLVQCRSSLLESHIDLGRWKITSEWVRQYLEAVGDTLPHYMELGIVPPLAISALALGNLLKKLALPGGVIHSLQEVNTVRAVRLGEELVGGAGLERPRQRANLQFITASYWVRDAAGNEVQKGKSTVLVPLSEDA